MAAGESINAASQGVLVSFQKLLDPTSVVRESEYARSANGLSAMERIEGFATKIRQGGAGLTAEGLAEFVELGQLFYENFNNEMLNFAKRTETQASNFGLNLENILTPNDIALLEQNRGGGGGGGESINIGGQDVPVGSIIENSEGQRAKVNADGTVTPI